MIWHVESGTYLGALKGHADYIQNLVYSPDGSILASGSYDGTVVLWDPVQLSDIYWVEQMTQDETGNWLPPYDVLEQIEADYKAVSEAKREVFFASDPPDLGLYEASLPDWYSGEVLEFYQDQYLDDLRAGKFTYGVAEWEECSYQVRECRQSGLECKIVRSCSNGTRYKYNFTTGQMTSEFDDQLGTVIVPLRYDALAGTWKTYDHVEFIPPEESANIEPTAVIEATQAAEAGIVEINKILQMTDKSSEMGSLLWLQSEPVQISLNRYNQMIYEPFDGDPQASDFVLYSEVTWESTGGLAGCNLIFRSGPNFKDGPQYDLETIRLSGLPGWDIIYFNDSEVQKNVTGVLTAGVIDQGQGAMNKILLIAEGNKFTVYFNDERIGSYYDYSKNLMDGLFAFEAWQETGKTTCTFENTWVWSLK
jgi:hypothetical protein